MLKKIGVSVVLILFLSAITALASNSFGPGWKEQVRAVNGKVSIPPGGVLSEAKFFRFAGGDGREIRFFLVRGTDGALRAAFDACEACFRAKKGYYQDGKFMVCRNCGMWVEVDSIGGGKGGCNPVALNFTQDPETIVIQVADLQSGSRYF
jgi:uncharacterized membrane protein